MSGHHVYAVVQSPLEIKSWKVVNGQWVLGTEPRSSAGAAHAVNHWANRYLFLEEDAWAMAHM